MTLYEKLMVLQTQAVSLIEAIPELEAYSVAAEVKGDLGKQIQQSLAKMKLAIVVITPITKVRSIFSGRVVREVQIKIGIYETALMNKVGGVRLSALKTATLISEALHAAPNGFEADGFDDEPFGEFRLIENEPEMELLDDEKTGQLIYTVTLNTVI